MQANTVILGVEVGNPTAAWMQLKNARRVIETRERWHNSAWHDGGSMCLANAVRFVTRGQKGRATDFSGSNGGDPENVIEALMLAAINRGMVVEPDRMAYGTYTEIPQFNDESGRTHGQILKAMDVVLELLKPHAQVQAVVFSDDVMTKEEAAEQRKAVWKVEDEMWAQERLKWGIKKDKKGVWRTRAGHYAKVPYWVKQTPKVKVDLPATDNPVQLELRAWLDDHEARGWETFWDELQSCNTPECREAVRRAHYDNVLS